MITTTTDTPLQTVYNYVDGAWIEVKEGESLPVINPATQEILSYVPLTSKLEVGRTVTAARTAADEWGRMPALERIQYLFGLKNLLERDLDGLARQITLECGKTYAESVAEMQRAIENVEVACGIPILLQGEVSEDIAPGIDEMMLRQPLGVTAAVLPFNFPGMILFWFMPYAVACGNTMVVKPSEKTPLTMQWIFRLIEEGRVSEGRIEHGEWRSGNCRRVARPSRRGQPKLCGFHPRGALSILSGGSKRQTSAMPGWRKKSCCRDARCRYGNNHPDHNRQRVWLCRSALPGSCHRHHGWFSQGNIHRTDLPGSQGANGGFWPR